MDRPEPANWIVVVTLAIASIMSVFTLSSANLDGDAVSLATVLTFCAMPWLAPIALIYRFQGLAAAALMLYGSLLLALAILGLVWFLIPIGWVVLLFGGVVLLEAPLEVRTDES